MKKITFLFLIFISKISFGQITDPEIIELINRQNLDFIKTINFKVKNPKNQDSLITLYSDSLRLKFRIHDLSKVKSKNHKINQKYTEGLKKIRKYYASGQDSLQINELNISEESLFLVGALSSGKPIQITFKNKILSEYKCIIYGDKSNDHETLFIYLDNYNHSMLVHSTIICTGPIFRNK